MNFIKKLILSVVASGLAVFATTYYLPEYLIVSGGIEAFGISGVIFGILNSVLKPILKLISLPFIFITAGLFVFVVNGAIIFLTEYFFKLMPSLGVVFEIQGGILSYVVVAVVLGIINHITHWFVDIK